MGNRTGDVVIGTVARASPRERFDVRLRDIEGGRRCLAISRQFRNSRDEWWPDVSRAFRGITIPVGRIGDLIDLLRLAEDQTTREREAARILPASNSYG